MYVIKLFPEILLHCVFVLFETMYLYKWYIDKPQFLVLSPYLSLCNLIRVVITPVMCGYFLVQVTSI